jgi:hypothetical protein
MRSIPDPGFAGDDGAADPQLAAALAAYDADPQARHHETLAVLQHTRLLVPVVAVLGEIERGADGPARETSSDMAAVLMTGRDGRSALLAFTGSATLTAWDPDARPVPVTVHDAARAALQDDADALLVDVAGPVMMVVDRAELGELARGHVLVPVAGGWGWATTEA